MTDKPVQFTLQDTRFLRSVGIRTNATKPALAAEYQEKLALIDEASTRAREIEHLTSELLDTRGSLVHLLCKVDRREKAIGWLVLANFVMLIILLGASRS